MARKAVVPEAIADCWREYSGKEFEGVVATREAEEFFAVLVRDEEGQLFAVTFDQVNRDGRLVWDVSSDGVEFDSVVEFRNTPLVKSLF